jgi:hypothetical protein
MVRGTSFRAIAVRFVEGRAFAWTPALADADDGGRADAQQGRLRRRGRRLSRPIAWDQSSPQQTIIEQAARTRVINDGSVIATDGELVETADVELSA